MMRKPFTLVSPAIAILLSFAFFDCNSGNSTRRQQTVVDARNDSEEVVTLLKKVYRWHDQHQTGPIDFEVIVKDSVQTGLNYDSFHKTFTALQQTQFFSASFIDNYKRIADSVNNTLVNAHPKYLNEINFPFQDADPWTGFQDDAPAFWDSLTITGYIATADSAALKWSIQSKDWTSEPYAIKFLKENGQWKVAYLQGFDLVKIFAK